jgi:hypothetical protein
MTPEAHNTQFSRQIWQTVSEHAHGCLLRREFCPEQSRVENLRCVDFSEESDCSYGKQIWFFEAIGVDPVGRRHLLHGALEFSVQYGLLEAAQAVMFEDEEARDQFLSTNPYEMTRLFPSHLSHRFWVTTVCSLFAILALVWTFALLCMLNS